MILVAVLVVGQATARKVAETSDAPTVRGFACRGGVVVAVAGSGLGGPRNNKLASWVPDLILSYRNTRLVWLSGLTPSSAPLPCPALPSIIKQRLACLKPLPAAQKHVLQQHSPHRRPSWHSRPLGHRAQRHAFHGPFQFKSSCPALGVSIDESIQTFTTGDHIQIWKSNTLVGLRENAQKIIVWYVPNDTTVTRPSRVTHSLANTPL